jgi:hypothetical protein
MTTRTRKLLPCPFCGGEAKTRRAESACFGGAFYVACRHAIKGNLSACPLAVQTVAFTTRAAAWSAWNRRAPTPSPEVTA